jgi:ubiquinone/menaquinone biosynthesis C-methylase UbiE
MAIELVQRVQFIKDACRGRKVLHLGCTNWPYTTEALENNSLLHLELDGLASELWGLDFDQEGLDILAEKGITNLYQADLEKLEELGIDETFEVIVAGEMIEHLNNPGLFLRGIQRFMNAETSLLITTVNAYCGFRMLYYALRGKGGAAEPVHPDHVAYYSYSTLSLLVKRAGLEVNRFFFYDLGPEHRATAPWHTRLANDVCVGISKQLADGLIAECKLPPKNGKV